MQFTLNVNKCRKAKIVGSGNPGRDSWADNPV
jgi:hypothetical protein